MQTPEEKFVANRSDLTRLSIGCCVAAERLLDLRYKSVSSHQQSIDGELGGGPYSEGQFINNWTYLTSRGEITLELAISPQLPDWGRVVTVTTTDGFSEVFTGYDNNTPILWLLADQLKRIKSMV